MGAADDQPSWLFSAVRARIHRLPERQRLKLLAGPSGVLAIADAVIE
jgi:hypothetical protein